MQQTFRSPYHPINQSRSFNFMKQTLNNLITFSATPSKHVCMWVRSYTVCRFKYTPFCVLDAKDSRPIFLKTNAATKLLQIASKIKRTNFLILSFFAWEILPEKIDPLHQTSLLQKALCFRSHCRQSNKVFSRLLQRLSWGSCRLWTRLATPNVRLCTSIIVCHKRRFYIHFTRIPYTMLSIWLPLDRRRWFNKSNTVPQWHHTRCGQKFSLITPIIKYPFSATNPLRDGPVERGCYVRKPHWNRTWNINSPTLRLPLG